MDEHDSITGLTFRQRGNQVMEIFDISRPLSDELAPWPGDTPFRFEQKWKMADGATVNVGAISMSLHNGTHADAPFHFSESGVSIECVPVDSYVGNAVVADLTKLYRNNKDAKAKDRRIGVT